MRLKNSLILFALILIVSNVFAIENGKEYERNRRRFK